MDITTILIFVLLFVLNLFFNFVCGPIFGRFLRRNFRKQTIQIINPKRPLIGTVESDGNNGVLIKRFKHKTSKGCDFCFRPAVMVVNYDNHKGYCGDKVFCCDKCNKTAIFASRNFIGLPFLDKNTKRLIEDLRVDLEQD